MDEKTILQVHSRVQRCKSVLRAAQWSIESGDNDPVRLIEAAREFLYQIECITSPAAGDDIPERDFDMV